MNRKNFWIIDFFTAYVGISTTNFYHLNASCWSWSIIFFAINMQNLAFSLPQFVENCLSMLCTPISPPWLHSNESEPSLTVCNLKFCICQYSIYICCPLLLRFIPFPFSPWCPQPISWHLPSPLQSSQPLPSLPLNPLWNVCPRNKTPCCAKNSFWLTRHLFPLLLQILWLKPLLSHLCLLPPWLPTLRFLLLLSILPPILKIWRWRFCCKQLTPPWIWWAAPQVLLH